jgi:LysM repeat protein
MKMPKLPTFLAMKPRKKLHATAAARRAQQIPDNYDEDEPQTRLSSAFVVVLILHVVAVGGIYAFNSIRSHRKLSDAPAQTIGTKADAAAPTTAAAAALTNQDNHLAANATPTTSLPATPAPQPSPATGRTHRVVAGETLTKIAQQYNVTVGELETVNGAKNVATLRVGQIVTIPKANAVTPARTETAPKVAATGTKSTGKIYVVAKGDSAVAIAKKLGVSSSELLKLNNIDDPKKLQIGQTLKVPPKK